MDATAAQQEQRTSQTTQKNFPDAALITTPAEHNDAFLWNVLSNSESMHRASHCLLASSDEFTAEEELHFGTARPAPLPNS
eukprot:scaffold2137_cov170-Pinguiococcus_pyrenoidosus.AAC.1